MEPVSYLYNVLKLINNDWFQKLAAIFAVAYFRLQWKLVELHGDCSLVRRFYSLKVRKSEIKGSSFRRFVSPKVRKSDNDIDSFLF